MLDDIRPDRQLDVAPPDGVSASDYHLIEDAVMDTARGRWFLREYARRIRKAETAQLLDALSRIEKSVEESKSLRLAGPANTEAETAAVVPASSEELLAVQEKLLDIVWYMRERGFDNHVCSAVRLEAGKLAKIATASGPEQAASVATAASDVRDASTADIGPEIQSPEIALAHSEEDPHVDASLGSLLASPSPASRLPAWADGPAPVPAISAVEPIQAPIPSLISSPMPDDANTPAPQEYTLAALDGLSERERLRLFA